MTSTVQGAWALAPSRRARLLAAAAFTTAAVAPLAPAAEAEEFRLDPIVVEDTSVHPSQRIREGVGSAFNSSRSVSEVGGSVIQNLNPINTGDAIRYNATGLVNTPGGGNRFGGGTKIRTFGDWGASESIDGLPAFKAAGEEGGGYSNTFIPSIAIDRVRVLKGGRAVTYGDGTDGGVVETRIKSGRNYKDHQAISLDASTAREGLIQGEAADSTADWDYYMAAHGFYGHYKGNPDNLDEERVYGGLGKVGYNLSEDTRAEALFIYDRNEPDIVRSGAINEISTDQVFGSATLDHQITEHNSLQLGFMGTHSRSQWPARSRDRSIDNQIGFLNHYLTVPVMDGVQYDGSLGFEYKRTNTERDDAWNNTFNDVAISSQNAFTFDDNLKLTFGARHTWFDNHIVYNGDEQPNNLFDDTVISYQVGASYSVFDDTRLRTSYATGYNRFFEKYGNFGVDVLNTTGAGDQIVESRTLEVGLNQGWNVEDFSGYFDIALYNIVQDGVPRRNGGQLENMEVDQSGLEVEVFARITEDLTVSAGYMRVLELEATRADGTEVNGNIFWDGQATPVPENQFNARIDFQLTDDIGLWGAGYYSTGYESTDADGSVVERDDFTRIDFGAGWWVTPNWALRARVENVLNERKFGQPPEGVAFDEEAEIGRVFWLGTDFSF